MNRIKELRKEKRLTQKELAKIMGVVPITISRWEKEERHISSDKAQALADYFGVSVGYLLGYSDYRKLSQIITHIHEQYPADLAWKISPLSKFGEEFIPIVKERYGEEFFYTLVNLLSYFTFDSNSSQLEGIYKYFLLKEESQQAINELTILLFKKDYSDNKKQ